MGRTGGGWTHLSRARIATVVLAMLAVWTVPSVAVGTTPAPPATVGAVVEGLPDRGVVRTARDAARLGLPVDLGDRTLDAAAFAGSADQVVGDDRTAGADLRSTLQTLQDDPLAAIAQLQRQLEERSTEALGAVIEAVDPVLGPLGVRTSAAVRAPIPFSAISFELPDDLGGVWFRTRGPEGWQPWSFLEVIDIEDGPDPGTTEDLPLEPIVTDLAWVGDAVEFEVRTPLGSSPEEVVAHLTDSLGLGESLIERLTRLLDPSEETSEPPARATRGDARPSIVSRAQWGADESLNRGSTSEARPRFAVLHHTATRNAYTRDEAPGIVRAIHRHHTVTMGWSDIGYNLLIDRFGRVYEGRRGGVERGIVGAHARGYNTGSFGVALIGDHDQAPASDAAYGALAQTISWKYRVHGIDASRDGRAGHANGTVRTLIGHRDVGSTACPGRYLYQRMGELRRDVEARRR